MNQKTTSDSVEVPPRLSGIGAAVPTGHTGQEEQDD